MAAKEGPTLRAIVSGGTGATGQCLVPELLKSPEYSEVTVIGRRKLTIDPVFSVDQEKEESSGRLKQVVVDFDEVTSENCVVHFKNKDVYFCCLGTTRAKAGSAENFRKVDFHLIVKLAEIAKAAEVRHISLVSSSMATAHSIFLYLRTKGEAEDAVMKMDFKRTTIWRPGALVRFGSGKVSRFFSRVASGLQTEQLGKALALEAVSQARQEGASSDEKQDAQFLENSAIYAILRPAAAVTAAAAAETPAAAETTTAAEAGEGSAVAEEAPGDTTATETTDPAAPATEAAAPETNTEPEAAVAAGEPVSVSEPAESAPEASEPVPEASEPAPEAGDPAPEASDPAPEVGDPAPEASEPAPEANEPAEASESAETATPAGGDDSAAKDE